MLITVFTPTYNRAPLLPRVYDSLCKQTFGDFEWVIVDDGSKDETKILSQTLLRREESFFPIRYYYQENGGKHRAINRGVKEAEGELILILDSDDSLPPNALQDIYDCYVTVKDKKGIGGVAGFMAHHDGKIIGHGCDFDTLDTNAIDVRYKYHLKGDMCEVFRTKVLKEFPFPEVYGEKFCPEALVWNRIATKYKLRYFNKVIYCRDYLDGGLTSKIVKIRMQSPVASMMCYQELVNCNIPFKDKVKASINYWRFAMCTDNPTRKVKISWAWYWTAPLGFVMHLMDKKNCR